MDDQVRRYLSQIGRKGGRRSRRTLDSETARRMVRLREARRAFRLNHSECFRSYDPDYRIDFDDIDWVAEQLVEYGSPAARQKGRELFEPPGRPAAIDVDRKAIADLCARYEVHTLSLFGSVLGDDFGPESDIDVLVEFEPGHTPGFFGLHGLEQELSGVFGGRKIDLVTRKSLNRRIRRQVLDQAQVIYAQG